MTGFVYLWFDRKHKRFYIGSHWGSIDDGYICSSSWMKNAYHRRPQDFKRRILQIVEDRNKLLPAEQSFLDKIKPNEVGKRYYNLKLTARGGFAKTYKRFGPHTKESNEKRSESLKGKPWSEARRAAQIGNYNRVKPVTDETRAKMSANRKGKKLSKHHRQRITETHWSKKNK